MNSMAALKPGQSDGHDVSTAARMATPVGSQILLFENNEAKGYALPDEGTLLLGRAREAQILLQDPSTSRRHAAIHLGTSVEIEDLGSANGTSVDGQRLQPGRRVPFPLGTVANLGDVRAVLRREWTGPDPMARVHEIIGRVAPSDVNIILVGETGVGKEVMSEAIHQGSKRAAGPFLRLNCAAMPENLIESELFGHERGAFTGALQTKIGLLEAAQGGTILLDEIGELPLQIQVRLLRVLENREIQRIGALKPRSIDVRFIAATHRDLDVMTAMGQFRQDLVFRLNGITIQVPPLRDRVPEIASLAKLFLAQACRRAGRPPVSLSANAILFLESYRWPGNVRELRNVIERAMLLSGGESIEVDHLTFGKAGAPSSTTLEPIFVRAPRQSAPPPPPSQERLDNTGPLTVAKATLPPPAPSERERIVQALERCGGNQKEAANVLGITRRMLRYRMEKLNLPLPRKGTRDT